jgi:general secretion pathway protein F
MGMYRFTAMCRDGHEISAEENHASLAALEQALGKRQMVLLKVREVRGLRLTADTIAGFITELARLLNSGIVLDKALQSIAEDSREAKLSNLASSVREAIKQGQPLSSALSQMARIDPLIIAMLRVGEASGQLGQILVLLEEHYESARALRRDLLASLAYPSILSILGLVSIVGLGLFVIPVFKEIFTDNPVPLPWSTQLVFAMSDFLIAYGRWLFLAGILVFTGSALLLRMNESAQMRMERFLLQLPLVGEALASYEAGKTLRVLGIMLQSGIPLVQAMEYARDTLSLRLQRLGVDESIRLLRKGIAVPVAFNALPELPRLAKRFIRVGNETGKLPDAIQRAASIIQAEVRNRIKLMVSVLDPIIILFMGGLVGFVVIAMLLAVFSLSDIK